MTRGIALYAVMIAFACLAWASPAAAAGAELTYLAHEPTIKSLHPPLIILLHGSGADERDMIGLWSQLPSQFVVISPRAPFPDAGGGYRWYQKTGVREADIDISRKIVDVLVDSAVKRFDADPAEVFVAGFSQGAVMAYEVGLREPGKFRGAAVLSGTLFPSAMSKLSGQTDWTHGAFFIAHGTADDRIAFSSTTAARAALARLHVPNEFHAYAGMRHGIGDAETQDLSAWLSKRLAIQPDATSH